MSYARKRQILFTVLATAIILLWAPIRERFASDALVFLIILGMIIGGYILIERLIGKMPRDD